MHLTEPSALSNLLSVAFTMMAHISTQMQIVSNNSISPISHTYLHSLFQPFKDHFQMN